MAEERLRLRNPSPQCRNPGGTAGFLHRDPIPVTEEAFFPICRAGVTAKSACASHVAAYCLEKGAVRWAGIRVGGGSVGGGSGKRGGPPGGGVRGGGGCGCAASRARPATACAVHHQGEGEKEKRHQEEEPPGGEFTMQRQRPSKVGKRSPRKTISSPAAPPGPPQETPPPGRPARCATATKGSGVAIARRPPPPRACGSTLPPRGRCRVRGTARGTPCCTHHPRAPPHATRTRRATCQSRTAANPLRATPLRPQQRHTQQALRHRVCGGGSRHAGARIPVVTLQCHWLGPRAGPVNGQPPREAGDADSQRLCGLRRQHPRAVERLTESRHPFRHTAIREQQQPGGAWDQSVAHNRVREAGEPRGATAAPSPAAARGTLARPPGPASGATLGCARGLPNKARPRAPHCSTIAGPPAPRRPER